MQAEQSAAYSPLPFVITQLKADSHLSRSKINVVINKFNFNLSITTHIHN